MVKIPTLFMRGGKEYDFHVIPVLHPGCAWVLEGKGLVTVKVDGLCVKVMKDADGVPRLYRRLRPSTLEYSDAPFIPCLRDDHTEQNLFAAFDNYRYPPVSEGIYEAFGPNIQGNPQGTKTPGMVKINPVDGALIVRPDTVIKRGYGHTLQDLFDSIKAELAVSPIEGLVFVLEDPPMVPKSYAKIKRKDFGFDWPIKPAVTNVEHMVQEVVGSIV